MAGYNPFSRAAKLARGKGRPAASSDTERLVSVALMRAGRLEHGHNSHAKLRQQLGDANPYASTPGDQEGFYTSAGRFVTRREAAQVALGAGQIHASMARELLSSDVW